MEFTNRLEVPTAMHWHGIRNLNEMDGVPNLTQAAIALCDSFDLQTIRLATAQRADIMVEMPAGELGLEEVSTGESVGAAMLKANGLVPAMANSPAVMAWYDRPDLSGARVIDVYLEGGAIGNLLSTQFEGDVLALRDLAQAHSKLWAFNGIVGGYYHLLAYLVLGEVSVLRIWNDTRSEHSMHLHGHHFWADSREFGDKVRSVLRDTYLMTAGERADLVFVANNPKMWLFHCHMMEHHASGMGAVISVT